MSDHQLQLALRERKEGWKPKKKAVKKRQKIAVKKGLVERAPVSRNIAKLKAEIAKDEKELAGFPAFIEKGKRMSETAHRAAINFVNTRRKVSTNV